MRKFYLFLFSFLVLFLSFDVSAAESSGSSIYERDDFTYVYDSENEGRDELGRLHEGFFCSQFYSVGSKGYLQYFTKYRCSDDYCLYIVYDPNKVYGKWSIYCSDPVRGVEILENSGFSADGFSGTVLNPSANWHYVSNGYTINRRENGDDPEYTDCTFHTNLPIFDVNDTEAIKAYIGEGDTTGALNQFDLPSSPKAPDDLDGGNYDTDVLRPDSLKTRGNLLSILRRATVQNNYQQLNIGCIWDCNNEMLSNNYSYDLQVKVHYTDSGKNDKDTGWKTVVSNYPYETGSTVDLYTGESVKRGATPESYVFGYADLGRWTGCSYCFAPGEGVVTGMIGGSYCYVNDVSIRVRNRSGNNYSSWVQVDFTGKYNSTYTTDDKGNRIDDEFYNGQDVTDPSYNSDKGGSSSIGGSVDGLPGLIDFVKGGFGIVGTGGLLAMFQSFFSYIPSSYWNILYTGAACMVILGIAKVILFS